MGIIREIYDEFVRDLRGKQLKKIIVSLDHQMFIDFHNFFKETELSRVILESCIEEFKIFIKTKAKEYTKRRKVITFHNFIYYIRHGEMDLKFRGIGYCDVVQEEIQKIVDEEYRHQLKTFTRYKANIKDECWEIFFSKGNSLIKVIFDFSDFKSLPLQYELKEYIYFQLYYTRDKMKKVSQRLRSLRSLLLILIEENTNIRYAKDITYTDMMILISRLEEKVKEGEWAFSTYRTRISEMRMFIDFLIGKEEYKERPIDNHFRKIIFNNSSRMEQDANTIYIPDNIIQGIQEHL